MKKRREKDASRRPSTGTGNRERKRKEEDPPASVHRDRQPGEKEERGGPPGVRPQGQAIAGRRRREVQGKFLAVSLHSANFDFTDFLLSLNMLGKRWTLRDQVAQKSSI